MAAHWWGTASSWPSKATAPGRRNSDTRLLANPVSRIKKLELSRPHSLPDRTCRQLDNIFESVTVVGAPEDDLWLQDSELHAKIAHKMEAHFAHTGEEKVQVKHGDKKGLYSRRSSKHLGMFDRSSRTLYSSDPDIYAAQEHLDYPDMPSGQLSLDDLRADLDQADEIEGHRVLAAPSKITNIFSNITADCYSQARKSRKGLRLSRKHSLDSQLVSKKKQHISRSAQSKRAIKIAHSEYQRAMYISGADTLGGLPDDEDGQLLHRKHLLYRLSALHLELDPLGALSRGSSCPVIFEGEESDESVEAGQQLYMSSSLDRGSRFLSLTYRDDLVTSDQTTSSSGEFSHSLSPRVSNKADQSSHFFIGSDPYDGSDDIDEGNSRKLWQSGTSNAGKASAVEAAPQRLRREDNSLGESMRTGYAREPNATSDQLVSRKQITPSTLELRSKKQQQTKRDGPVVRAEISQATVHRSTCPRETRSKDNSTRDSQDVKSKTDITTEASSDGSDSYRSETHPSSDTSSADESSS